MLFSDADTLDRSHDGAAQSNKNMDIASTVSLLNQERDNNRLYVSLVQSRATFYADDKTLPNLPSPRWSTSCRRSGIPAGLW